MNEWRIFRYALAWFLVHTLNLYILGTARSTVYPLNLIDDSTSEACDLFQRWLDFQHGHINITPINCVPRFALVI